MFAWGRTVVSAWWVGWWCWNIPSSSSWADWDRELHANTHAARKRCLWGAGWHPYHSVCLALCLNLILPPVCKRQCLKAEGPGLSPAVGGKDTPTRQALHVCLSSAGEASVHSSSLVALAPVGWVCLSICSVWKSGCVLLTKSCQCPHVTPAGGFPWTSGRSFLWVLLSAGRVAAGRFCTGGEQYPPVFYLLAPAKGSTEQFTRLNKYLDLLLRANIA